MAFALLLAAFLLAPLAILRWWIFPIDREFVAVSLNGKGLGIRSLTFRVVYLWKPELGWHYVAHGSVGCNFWGGRVDFEEHGRLRFWDMYQTALGCVEWKIQEQPVSAFLSAVRGADRWRMESQTLVLGNDRDILRLVQGR